MALGLRLPGMVQYCHARARARAVSGGRRRAGDVVQFRPDGRGVGVVQVVEDGQGLLPVVAGGLVVPVGLVGFAEVDEGLGAEVAVAVVRIGVQGLLVVGDCLAVAAGVVAAVAKAVQLWLHRNGCPICGAVQEPCHSS